MRKYFFASHFPCHFLIDSELEILMAFSYFRNAK